ncbi:hypothetical protein B296_00008987 [Ensete ventricosum]|uniref:Uncharacterized protein n=1 Tax=Ensete ventricosum TaxID=4639 RepID=A0A427APZ7_ENSVE|nr:hypothetical protein B296_00008987 [Ensete ventricosum]
MTNWTTFQPQYSKSRNRPSAIDRGRKRKVEEEEKKKKKKKKRRRSTSSRPSGDSARGSPASRHRLCCPSAVAAARPRPRVAREPSPSVLPKRRRRRPRVIFLPTRERVRGDTHCAYRPVPVQTGMSILAATILLYYRTYTLDE